MTSAQTNPHQDAGPGPGRSDRQRLPLIAAVGLAVVAALILVYELAVIASDRPPNLVVLGADNSAAAPVPLSSQPFSFLDQPAPVPELNFVDGNNRPLSLADFRGRPVLLNLWATWCLPCRKEMPSLDRLQAKFDPSKFRVVTLSIDRGGIPAVKKFYADLSIKSLGIYVDQSGGALRQLGFFGVPGTLLIDPQGREIGRKLGPAEWDSPEVLAVLRQRLGLEAPTAPDGVKP